MRSNNLKASRQFAGLTQQQCADKIGVDLAVISRWETGFYYPTMPFLGKIEKVYQNQIQNLFPEVFQ